jgi:hypothetical protein
MDFYQRNLTDPDWLARISEYHGHLGPWLVAGALAGRDAIRRLETPGHWKIDVVCWMPSDKHRTPFSCILDGLQASCGATMGKRNLRLVNSFEGLAGRWPAIHVVRLPDINRPPQGVAYLATEELHNQMRKVTPDRLEECSRQLAGEDTARLFEIAAMSEEDLARVGRTREAQGGLH